jgi:hypothetical protein
MPVDVERPGARFTVKSIEADGIGAFVSRPSDLLQSAADLLRVRPLSDGRGGEARQARRDTQLRYYDPMIA